MLSVLIVIKMQRSVLSTSIMSFNLLVLKMNIVKKVASETPTIVGSHKVELYTAGGFYVRYGKKFSDIHQGMLYVQDVPGFEFTLIDVSNIDKNSAGCCLLLGTCPRGGEGLMTI